MLCSCFLSEFGFTSQCPQEPGKWPQGKQSAFQCYVKSATITNTSCTNQLWAITSYFLVRTCWHMFFPKKPKHAHCLLYSPPRTSTLSPSFIFTFSQLSAAHHFKKKPFLMLRVCVCLCVYWQYKAALTWAWMKTHSWQGIGEYQFLRCQQGFFFLCDGQITVCVKKIWLSQDDSCKRQVNVNIKQHPNLLQKYNIFQGEIEAGFSARTNVELISCWLPFHLTLYLPTSLSFMHCYAVIPSVGHIYLICTVLLFLINTSELSNRLVLLRLPNYTSSLSY